MSDLSDLMALALTTAEDITTPGERRAAYARAGVDLRGVTISEEEQADQMALAAELARRLTQ